MIKGGMEVTLLLRLPPPGNRVTVLLLAADVALELVVGADDVAEDTTDVEELWPVLEYTNRSNNDTS